MMKNNLQNSNFRISLGLIFFILFTSVISYAHMCSTAFQSKKYFDIDNINLIDYEGHVDSDAPLNVQSLNEAYSAGIFPWGMRENGTPNWFIPKERPVLDVNSFKVKRSLRKQFKGLTYTVTINQAFEKVIEICATIKRHEKGNGIWITPEIKQAYINLHKNNLATSVEVWENNELVGGLYGVLINKMFFGESMFHTKPNASKLAFVHLVEYLKSIGVLWIDTQVESTLMTIMGSKTISGEQYKELLLNNI